MRVTALKNFHGPERWLGKFAPVLSAVTVRAVCPVLCLPGVLLKTKYILSISKQQACHIKMIGRTIHVFVLMTLGEPAPGERPNCAHPLVIGASTTELSPEISSKNG